MDYESTLEPKFKRKKSLERSFQRLVLNENDLMRIGMIVKELADKYGGEPYITITSADERETIDTEDPDFFISKNMPPDVGRISLHYRHYTSPVSCMVSLPTQYGASMTVEGTERDAVLGTYYELERELSLRTGDWAQLIRALTSVWGSLVLGLLIAAAVFSLFDLALKFLSPRIPGLDDPETHDFIIQLGLLLSYVIFIWSIIAIPNRLKRAFPPVHFTGRLASPHSRERRYLLFVLLAVLIPILVNVFSNLLSASLFQP